MAPDLPRVLVVGDRRTMATVADALDGRATVVGRADDDPDDLARAVRPDATDSVDCVVCDHAPPTVDGLAVLRTVGDRPDGPPVVMFPRDGSERLAADALAAGAAGYVPRSSGGGEDGDAAGTENDTGAGEDERLAARVEAVCVGIDSDDIDPDDIDTDDVDPDDTDTNDVDPEAEASDRALRLSGGSPDPDERTVADGTSGADRFLEERALAEAPVGVTIAEAGDDRPLIYVNDSFESLTGYSEAEVLGRNCRFLQGSETDEAAVEEMRAALDAGREVEVEIRNYRRDGTTFWNEVTIAPVHDADGELTHFVGFQSDVTKRKEAELALAAEHEHLEHVLDRMNGLLGDITDTLVAAASREEVERAVCERLAAADPYAFAWLAAPDRAGETFRARAWSGDAVRAGAGGDAPASEASGTGAGQAAATGPSAAELATPDVPDSPLREAIDRREVVVRDVADLPDEQVPPSLAGYETVAAVPLRYRETSYGVVAVYANGPFDERDADVLEALGRAVATALNALESKRVLTADNVGELELTLADPSLFFVDVSRRADCRLEYTGSVYGSDGTANLFFTVEGAPVERVAELAEESPDVAAASVLAEREDAGIVEVALAEESVVALLADVGARTQSLVAEDGEARIRVTLPTEADAGALLDRLGERYAGTEFRSYRERTRPAKTKTEYLASVRDRLTDRQYAALRKAYIGGYFERPRPVTGDDLAASMGVTRATFHQHLVAAQRKLLDEFFDETG